MFFSSRTITLSALKIFYRWSSLVRARNYHELGSNYELNVANPTGLSRDKSKGVVYLLGWLGCVDKQLAKYSTIYQNMGFTVIRFSPWFKAMYTPRSLDSCRKQDRKMVDLTDQNGGSFNHIFFHSFSNTGGSLTSLFFDEFTNAQKMKMSVKGFMLDSAQRPLTFFLCYRVVLSIFPQITGTKVLAPIVASAFYPYMVFCYYFNLDVDWFTGQQDTLYCRFYLWKDLSQQLDFRCRQLCLYSKADQIVKSKYIDQFVDERVKRGVVVKVSLFRGSSHVSHLRKYPVEYETAIREFVREYENNR